MCFIIDTTARRSNKRVVYKAVILSRGIVRSMLYSYRWSTGEHKIDFDAKTEEWTGERLDSYEGIYVYNSLREAENNVYRHHNEVILKLNVRPQDWLYTNFKQTVSTYRRVWVPEDQPYLEWY